MSNSAGDSAVNDFIIGQSFEENQSSNRSKEFCIDNAEYTEVKPRNMKRKILVISLSLVGFIGAGVVAGIQSGIIPTQQPRKSQQFPMSQPVPSPAATVTLPASLQSAPSGPVESLPAAPATVAQTSDAQSVAQPSAPSTSTPSVAVSLPSSLAQPQTVPPAASEQFKPATTVAAPEIKQSLPPQPHPAPVTTVAKPPVQSKVEVKPTPSKPVITSPVAVPTKTTQPENKLVHAIAVKPQPAQAVPKQQDMHVATSPILANDTDHAAGSVKPLNMVSADRIGLRALTRNGIQLQRGANVATYGVGDILPNGETIKFIDEKSMTIVTDKQVMRVTN